MEQLSVSLVLCTGKPAAFRDTLPLSCSLVYVFYFHSISSSICVLFAYYQKCYSLYPPVLNDV
ncbi:hypothetical protein MtrunA17_Chr8g0372451 [Medicago truncatula]|uniref:Transmembrane protein n=1 Tax=Medicago truncatula TaxID=3880 RepID=A0A396GNE7_MEDTR|nr:hypothetical protein MtrunA17_Chr8g0372451 [Medicago truncatula]